MIEALLNNVKQKRLEAEAVKMWLEELQDLAYDVEDILDEYATEALRRKPKMEEHQATTSWALKLIPACCISRTPSALRSDISMRSKIDDITCRLQNLCKQGIELGLVEIAGGRSTASFRRPTTKSLRIEPAVYGRDEDKAKILQLVLRDEPNDANFGVIPIWGMGGIGKTTLAGAVYNDEAVKDFNPKAWVCVSEDFDVLRISKEILEVITSSSCDMTELGAVQNQLKEALNGKTFLIVLDDVRGMNGDLWERLKAPFLAGAPGSKVIVTTREADVALAMRQRKYYHLKLLSNDDCWAMFVKHAFDFRDAPTDWNLNIIREKVVQKCGGWPLAAKILGGLLYHKETEDEWMNILNSEIWDLNNDIHPPLRLSYHYLPSHLKECFAYCSIFPRGYEFDEKDLVSLWRAQGLIQQSNKDLQLEDLGGQYFYDLLSRSIFQKSGSNTSKFVMHDIIYNLAQWAFEERFNGKKWNGNNGGDDDNNGGDDDNNGGGGGKNNKKGNHHDGDGNGDKDKRGHDHGGGEMKGKNMNAKGEAMFSYRFTYHAGTENGYPIGQLRYIREVQSLISLFYRAVMIC